MAIGTVHSEELDQDIYTVEYIDKFATNVSNKFKQIDNLGLYVPGPFNTIADLPTNADWPVLSTKITDNDFATVLKEPSVQPSGQAAGKYTAYRYVAKVIDNLGTLTWIKDIAYNSDVSGKMDVVKSAVNGDIAVFDANGQVVDGGVKLADLETKVNQAAEYLKNAYDGDMTPVGSDNAGTVGEYARGDHSHPSGWVFRAITNTNELDF